MRFVYAHFPINVVLDKDGTNVEVRNFLGEKINRGVALPNGVKAVRSEKVKDEIVLSGNDVDDVSQSGTSPFHFSCYCVCFVVECVIDYE